MKLNDHIFQIFNLYVKLILGVRYIIKKNNIKMTTLSINTKNPAKMSKSNKTKFTENKNTTKIKYKTK